VAVGFARFEPIGATMRLHEAVMRPAGASQALRPMMSHLTGACGAVKNFDDQVADALPVADFTRDYGKTLTASQAEDRDAPAVERPIPAQADACPQARLLVTDSVRNEPTICPTQMIRHHSPVRPGPRRGA
jgi:hypothetical protein